MWGLPLCDPDLVLTFLGIPSQLDQQTCLAVLAQSGVLQAGERL